MDDKREIARLDQTVIAQQRTIDALRREIEEVKAAHARLRRLVRIAVARGFIHQELREEIER